MVGAGAGDGHLDSWKLDPLKPAALTLELCDLCEVARVDYAPGSGYAPHKASVQVPVPPFDEGQNGRERKLGLDTISGAISLSLRRLCCACRIPAGKQELDALTSRVHREFCADARFHAGGLLVDTLFELAASPRGLPRYACASHAWGTRDLVMAAHAALSKRPELRLLMDFACILPAHRLADLLASAMGHPVERRPDCKTCVSVAGLDIITYSPGLLGPHAAHRCEQLAASGASPQDPLPAFIVPRRGSLGLALSDITVEANWDDGRLVFGGDYLVGADVLRSTGIVEVLPAISREA